MGRKLPLHGVAAGGSSRFPRARADCLCQYGDTNNRQRGVRRAMTVQAVYVCDGKSRVDMAASIIRNPEPKPKPKPKPAAGARVCCTCTCCSPVPGPGGTSHVERSAGTIVMGSARPRTGTSSTCCTHDTVTRSQQTTPTVQHSTARYSAIQRDTGTAAPLSPPTQPRSAATPTTQSNGGAAKPRIERVSAGPLTWTWRACQYVK